MSRLLEVGRYHIVVSQILYIHEVGSDRLRVFFIGGESTDIYETPTNLKYFLAQVDEVLQLESNPIAVS